MSAARRQRGSCGSGTKVAESSAWCNSSITSLTRSAVRSLVARVEQREDRLVQQRRHPHHEFLVEALAALLALQPGEVEIQRAHLDVGEHVDGVLEPRPGPRPRGPAAPASGPSASSPAWCRWPHRPAAPRGAYAGRAACPCGSCARPDARRRGRAVAARDRGDWRFDDSHWQHPVRIRHYNAIGQERIISHEQPQPGDQLRQRRPFHRPLCDADFRRRRDHHGAGARHGLFGTAALCDAGLHRLRRGLAAHRLARRPLEPPPHDADLLRRHRRSP